MLQDSYEYVRNDRAYNIFFMLKGAAGFVQHNFKKNIIFADIGEGDNFA